MLVDGRCSNLNSFAFPVPTEDPKENDKKIPEWEWKTSWKGKKIYKDNQVALSVIKGKVEQNDMQAQYKIDGLSGATITGRGVTNMVAYWFGDSGYASLLRELDYES